MDDKITITKEDGSEVEMILLFTFNSEEFGFDYVMYYDDNSEEGEVFPFRYDEQTHKLTELETEQEWQMVNEVLEAFLKEEE